VDALLDMLGRFPPGPFTRQTFLDSATGMNLVRNAADIDLILDQLCQLGLIYRFGSNRDTWAVLRSGVTTRSSASASSAGSGRANQYPCPSWHCSSTN
jgi:hypothetical protein